MSARERRQPVTVRRRPKERSLREEFFAPITPGDQAFSEGARAKPAPSPEKQLDEDEVEVDEDGLDAVDLMERGGLR